MKNTFFLLWIVLILFSCATAKVSQRGPTSTLVLRPRAGYQDKLTNKRCSKFKPHTSDCQTFDVVTFDFNDASVRKTLRDLKFICSVNGQRFSPCETSRGLCQLTKQGGGIFSKPKVVVNKYYSLHDDYDFLIGANTYCASLNSEVGKEMFSL